MIVILWNHLIRICSIINNRIKKIDHSQIMARKITHKLTMKMMVWYLMITVHLHSISNLSSNKWWSMNLLNIINFLTKNQQHSNNFNNNSNNWNTTFSKLISKLLNLQPISSNSSKFNINSSNQLVLITNSLYKRSKMTLL